MSQEPAAAETPEQRVAARYRRKPPATAIALLVILGAVIVALAVWLVWTITLHSSPKITSTEETWTADGESSVTVTATVVLHDPEAQDLECKVSVLAADHSVVGYAAFEPIVGRQSIVIRTEREGTSVDWKGCTAQGQNEPH